MVKPTTRSRPMPAPASTADALPTGQVGDEPTVEAPESSGDMEVDVEQAHVHDDLLDYDEEAGIVNHGSTSENSSPVITSRASTTTDVTTASNDQKLLQDLYAEREVLLAAKHAATRQLVAKRATLAEVEVAAQALRDHDKAIEYMREALQEEPPVGYTKDQFPVFTNHGAPRVQQNSGPSRNQRQRQQRFNPVARPQAAAVPNMPSQQPVTPPMAFTCNNCGPNRTHTTEQCITCMHCNKRGHIADECRGRLGNGANPNNVSGPNHGFNSRGRGGRGGRGRGSFGPNRG